MTSRAVPPAVLHPGGSYVLFLYQSVATAPWFPANGLHGIFDISDGHVTLGGQAKFEKGDPVIIADPRYEERN